MDITNEINVIKKYDLLYWEGKSEKVFVDGIGAELIDSEGNKYIDLSEITGVLGQGDEEFNSDVKNALNKINVEKGIASKYKISLFNELVKSVNDDFDKIFLSSSGSEAVEWAIRIAKNYSKKHESLSFWGGLHGRTYASASMSGIPLRKVNFGPQSQGLIFAQYPNCYRCPFNKVKETCNFFCLDYLDDKIVAESTQDIACLIIEPFQGTSGMIFPPKGYLKRLYEWAKERDIIFIMDEIQSGIGRTGKMYMYQNEGFVPDMLLLGKGLGNGFHISALLIKEEYTSRLNSRALSGGTGGNPICCAAATSVFKQLEKKNLIMNSKIIGEYIINKFNMMKNKYEIIGDVRGEGLAIGVEFVTDRDTKKPLLGSIDLISKKALQKGVIIGGGKNTLVIRPSLAITQKQAESVMQILEEIINEINKNHLHI